MIHCVPAERFRTSQANHFVQIRQIVVLFLIRGGLCLAIHQWMYCYLFLSYCGIVNIDLKTKTCRVIFC